MSNIPCRADRENAALAFVVVAAALARLPLRPPQF